MNTKHLKNVIAFILITLGVVLILCENNLSTINEYIVFFTTKIIGFSLFYAGSRFVSQDN